MLIYLVMPVLCFSIMKVEIEEGKKKKKKNFSKNQTFESCVGLKYLQTYNVPNDQTYFL